MPDRKSKLKERRRREWLETPCRRIRLYADEDLPSRAIAMLRAGVANVLTTAEAGNRGKDDTSQAAFAARVGRVIVTRNGKHFLDDRRVPLQSTSGVIALDFSDRSEDSALAATAIVTELFVPYAELFDRMKIRVSSGGAHFRFIDPTGAVKCVYFDLGQLFDGRYPADDYDGPPGHA
jgi:predicted nuclease of predicted toxin-antitoxin system